MVLLRWVLLSTKYLFRYSRIFLSRRWCRRRVVLVEMRALLLIRRLKPLNLWQGALLPSHLMCLSPCLDNLDSPDALMASPHTSFFSSHDLTPDPRVLPLIHNARPLTPNVPHTHDSLEASASHQVPSLPKRGSMGTSSNPLLFLPASELLPPPSWMTCFSP